MSSKLRERLDEVDVLWRRGKGPEAIAVFEQATKNGIDRPDAAASAALALRLGRYEQGLRILHPIVRPSHRRVSDATAAEVAEYGHLLIKHGAVAEGMKILETVDARDYPKVTTYRVSGLFARWDYGAALPLLANYVREPSLSAYERLVGQVNLAAALVHEGKRVPATALLRDLLHQASLQGYDFALARVLEIAAQHFIAVSDWAQAEEMLSQATKRLGASPHRATLYIRKFRALIALLRQDRGGEAAVLAVRAEAESLNHWETVRDCDRALAIAKNDKNLLEKLWFGTPYPAYRAKLVADFGGAKVTVPESYDWNPGPAGKPAVTIDLLTGAAGDGSIPFVPGTVPHRLVIVLGTDFYRPFRLPELFGLLFPDRFFDPAQSPGRVHDAIYAFRQRVEELALPLQIDETDGSYRLRATRAIALRLRRASDLGARHAGQWERLQEAFPGAEFSIQQAAQCLSLPRRTVFRLLAEACASGRLERFGAGRATRYRFPARKS